MLSTKTGSQSLAAVCLNLRRPSVAFLCAGLIACAAGGTTARAETYTWTGAISARPDEFWWEGNWTPAGGPPNDNADVARFTASPSSEYLVKWEGSMTNRSLRVESGVRVRLFGATTWGSARVYALDSATDSAFIGLAAGPLAQLTLAHYSGIKHSIEAGGFLVIGNAAGSNGKLVLEEFDWSSSSYTYVGNYGTGWLESDIWGSLTNTSGTVAVHPGSVGVVHMHGVWTNTSTLTIGNQGLGTLTIGGSGEVSNDGHGFIAKLSGSTGAVLMGEYEYSESTWDNNDSLYVGGSDTAAGGTATLTVGPGGVLTAANDLMLYSGNTVNLDGVINAGSLSGASNVLNWTAGELNITASDVTVGFNQPLGGNAHVGAGQTLTASGALRVGPVLGATMIAQGGATIATHSGVIGSTAEGSIPSDMLVNGDGTTWQMTGGLSVRGLADANLTIVDGAIVSNEGAFVAQFPDSHGDVTMSGAGARWDSTGALHLGGRVGTPGGTGMVRVDTGATLTVGSTLKVWYDYQLWVNGGTVVTTDLVVAGTIDVTSGTLDLRDGAMNIYGGGLLEGSILGNANTQVTLQDTGSTWSMTGPLDVGSDTEGNNQVASLLVAAGTEVMTDDTVRMLAPNAFVLTGGAVTAAEIDLGGADFQGFGALNGRIVGAGTVITATGDLAMGDDAHLLGFNYGGELQVGANTVTLNSLGYARPGALTTIQTGGILAAPNGLLLGSGDNLTGTGTVAAPVAADFGSMIIAQNGPLDLGDSTAIDGFFSDGILETGGNTVTIHDANQAVLGSVTVLGMGFGSGVLVAANGAVVEFGKNVIGFGAFKTPDDPTTPLINNGAIAGLAPIRQIVLSGYIKGVGTLDNVTITGTDAPGFSTARVYRGNVTYGGTLEIEIGGHSPGSRHDQINHSGQAGLGGELRIELLNGFEPDVGDRFVIMTFASHTGEFALVTGRGDCSGPVFRVEYNETEVTIVATDPLQGDINVDGKVNLDDYERLAPCLAGPDGWIAPQCECFDVDQSGAVDLQDFQVFQTAMTGG